MITTEKITQAQQYLQDHGWDAWIIASNETSDIHSAYLLGVSSHARHFICVAAHDVPTVIGIKMECPMISQALRMKGIEAKVVPYEIPEELPALLRPLLNKPRVALNFGEQLFTMIGSLYADALHTGEYFALKSLAPRTEFVSAAPLIYQLRSIKSSEELLLLRETVNIQEEIMQRIPDWVKIGIRKGKGKGFTERELRQQIDHEFAQFGEPCFETIVATGPHSADPHYNTGDGRIQPGVLLVDAGIKRRDAQSGITMCSDLTWTYWVDGSELTSSSKTKSGKQPIVEYESFLRAYSALYQAKTASYGLMTNGASFQRVDQKCREVLAKMGYDHERLYTHGLGHAIGFEVHDVGVRLNWKTPPEIQFENGMVYSNEPGLYWPEQWGIRLEDDIIIRNADPEIVSHCPREPLHI